MTSLIIAMSLQLRKRWYIITVESKYALDEKER